MKKNKIIWTSGILLLAILLGSLVSAFGTSYIFERPLQLYPGQTREIYVTLQNNNDPNTITATAEMDQETKIAELTDNLDTFTVPYRANTQVNLSFTAPADAKVGEMHRVKLRFIPQSAEGGGMGLVFVTGSNIDVLIVEKPSTAPKTEELAEESPIAELLVFIALAIVLIVSVLIYLVRKRKR